MFGSVLSDALGLPKLSFLKKIFIEFQEQFKKILFLESILSSTSYYTVLNKLHRSVLCTLHSMYFHCFFNFWCRSLSVIWSNFVLHQPLSIESPYRFFMELLELPLALRIPIASTPMPLDFHFEEPLCPWNSRKPPMVYVWTFSRIPHLNIFFVCYCLPQKHIVLTRRIAILQ